MESHHNDKVPSALFTCEAYKYTFNLFFFFLFFLRRVGHHFTSHFFFFCTRIPSLYATSLHVTTLQSRSVSTPPFALLPPLLHKNERERESERVREKRSLPALLFGLLFKSFFLLNPLPWGR